MDHHRRITVGAAAVAAVAIGFYVWRNRSGRRGTLRLAILNMMDGSEYNEAVPVMLQQLFLECGRPVELVEFNVLQGCYPQVLGHFDGFIIPGSAASSYERTPWILELEAFIRMLSEKRQKVLGICFGHQIIAQALGGVVEKNTTPTRAASVPFEFTSPEGCWLLGANASSDLAV